MTHNYLHPLQPGQTNNQYQYQYQGNPQLGGFQQNNVIQHVIQINTVPSLAYCHYCRKETQTKVQLQKGFCYVITFLLLFFFAYPFLVLLCCLDNIKDRNYRCVRCYQAKRIKQGNCQCTC